MITIVIFFVDKIFFVMNISVFLVLFQLTHFRLVFVRYNGAIRWCDEPQRSLTGCC